jgi:hypothetical protein
LDVLFFAVAPLAVVSGFFAVAAPGFFSGAAAGCALVSAVGVVDSTFAAGFAGAAGTRSAAFAASGAGAVWLSTLSGWAAGAEGSSAGALSAAGEALSVAVGALSVVAGVLCGVRAGALSAAAGAVSTGSVDSGGRAAALSSGLSLSTMTGCGAVAAHATTFSAANTSIPAKMLFIRGDFPSIQIFGFEYLFVGNLRRRP